MSLNYLDTLKVTSRMMKFDDQLCDIIEDDLIAHSDELTNDDAVDYLGRRSNV